MNSTSLYAVRAGTSGPVKIGSSERIDNRIAGLQTANHEEIRLLAAAEGMGSHEKLIHGLIAPRRIRGEWFGVDNGCMIHFCGPEGPAEVARLFEKMYEIAGTIMGDHEWRSEEAAK